MNKLSNKNFEDCNTIQLPADLIIQVYLFFPIEVILQHDIKMGELWSLLLKRDYNILNFIQPREMYIEKYENLYKQPNEIYEETLDYLINILSEKYTMDKKRRIIIRNDYIKDNESMIKFCSRAQKHFKAKIYAKKYASKKDNKNIYKVKKREYTEKFEQVLFLYENKLLENNDNAIFLLDKRLTEIILIDDLTQQYKITNNNGITLYDIIHGIYMFKKYECIYMTVQTTKIKNLSNSCKTIEITIKYSYD